MVRVVLVWGTQLRLFVLRSLTHLQCLVQKCFELVSCGTLDRTDLVDILFMVLLQGLSHVAVYCDSKTLVGVVSSGCGQ